MNGFLGSAARRGRSAGALLICAFCCGASPAAFAQSREVTTDPRLESSPAELRLAGGALNLSLDEAIEIALRRNLGLALERYSLSQARLGVDQALGIYDLGFETALSAFSEESPAASNLDGADVQEQDGESYRIGLSRLFPSGGRGSVGWSAARLETNSLFALLNPSYSSGLDVTFSQPLLRNAGRESTEFDLRVARLTSGQSRELFTEAVIAMLRNVEEAYWQLVEARDQLVVSEESKRLAIQLHDNNRVRVDVGTLAPLELVSSEAGIATREEEVIRARAAVGNAEDVLKTLLRLEGDQAWTASVLPETSPEIEHPQVDLAIALSKALSSRPELARERLAQQSRELEAAFFRRQRKPSLDLDLSYGYNGVGGDIVVRDDDGNVISTSPGGLSDAVDQITETDFPGWSVGLTFGYPIQNRSAKARATIAELGAEQGKLGISSIEQRVNTEVRLAVRALVTAEQELASAKVSVRLQNANLDAERKKFLNGLSTSFQILQVEEDLTAARSREVRAVTGYRRALVQYRVATGQLLEASGIKIEG